VADGGCIDGKAAVWIALGGIDGRPRRTVDDRLGGELRDRGVNGIRIMEVEIRPGKRYGA
jgi:hypothetical protein